MRFLAGLENTIRSAVAGRLPSTGKPLGMVRG